MKIITEGKRCSDNSVVASGWQCEEWVDDQGRVRQRYQRMKNHRSYRRLREGFPETKLTKIAKVVVVIEALLLAYVLGSIWGGLV